MRFKLVKQDTRDFVHMVIKEKLKMKGEKICL